MSSAPSDLLPESVELPGTRRLRFAPSPTGDLHIGNVRTALLSYCLAGEDGRFLVRIEDTDRERYQPEAVPRYLETLAWLGLRWDEGPDIGGPCEPYVESERLPYFQAAAERLVAAGAAYFCFCTKERLDELRAAQRTAGLPTRYDGHCRNLPPAEAVGRRERGEPSVVRLLVPPGETRWDDLVLGPQLVDNLSVDDQVLLKSDGFPTYHLAQVVDDHLMGITEVVRAVEWLPSTPKHLITYAALGWRPPRFAHVALVLGPDHSKLSKRHGAQTVTEFRELGYLPEALVNFLAFLGWSPGTEEEIFTLAELRQRMTFERLQSSPAILDQQRLDYLNGVWIRKLTVEQLAQRIKPFLPQATPEQLVPITAMVQERIRRLDQVPGLLTFAFSEPTPDADFLRGKLSREVARAFLEQVPALLDGDPDQLMDRLRSLAQELGVGDPTTEKKVLQSVMRVLRVATTGAEVTPPLPESIALIGKEAAVRRIQRAVRVLSEAG
ncbi:MAG TPA: glutamate--tRNA ligase [Candidatus Micrarchaeaceae archaeon]|nr:glutamate--tRNA ligase [Candidatus Micrarchaeaceae archaeon]HVB13269.1 glutamate--tRNA ligase [Candidatus Dormibacteraeota bacterium]